MQGEDGKDPGTVTSLLREVSAGNRSALEELFRTIQPDLRRYAQRVLNSTSRRDTTGTELVSMALARLLAKGPLAAQSRAHLLFLLGRAMRDALVDEARKSNAAIRGGGRAPSPLVEFAVDQHPVRLDVLDLHEALRELEARDPEGSRVVELRYFVGLTLEETAEAMECSLGAVRDHWTYARAWLAARLAGRP